MIVSCCKWVDCKTHSTMYERPAVDRQARWSLTRPFPFVSFSVSSHWIRFTQEDRRTAKLAWRFSCTQREWSGSTSILDVKQMGTISSKPSKKKFQTGQKKRPSCCCPCLSRSSSNSYSSSSFSIDEQYLPTFDRLLSKNKHRVSEVNSNAKVKAIANHSHDALDKRSQPYYFQSIENLEKSLHGTASIDRWVDSLPILGTPSLNRPSIQPTPCSLNENDAHFPVIHQRFLASMHTLIHWIRTMNPWHEFSRSSPIALFSVLLRRISFIFIWKISG